MKKEAGQLRSTINESTLYKVLYGTFYGEKHLNRSQL